MEGSIIIYTCAYDANTQSYLLIKKKYHFNYHIFPLPLHEGREFRFELFNILGLGNNCIRIERVPFPDPGALVKVITALTKKNYYITAEFNFIAFNCVNLFLLLWRGGKGGPCFDYCYK